MRADGTIAAVATGRGGAIAVIRVSGPDAIAATDSLFVAASGKSMTESRGYTLHYGEIRDEEGRMVDEVLVSLFHAPRSYTGEDMVEISCHASSYILSEIMRLLGTRGVRPAEPGEFTLRAYLNGKMDLAQAEAVADVIASEGRAAHALATRQIRGGYSAEFDRLHGQLLELISLLELELDFSEEEVEFADRGRLQGLMETILQRIVELKRSYSLGNVIRNGVPVAIVGRPNVGKSTLLNALLGDNRAMVSDIAGTTRDVIEDTVNLDGVTFRFIDTAGIRRTNDVLESMGIERTFDRMSRATIVLYLVDPTRLDLSDLPSGPESGTTHTDSEPSSVFNESDSDAFVAKMTSMVQTEIGALQLREDQRGVVVINKSDLLGDRSRGELVESVMRVTRWPVLVLSAKRQQGIDRLVTFLTEAVSTDRVYADEAIVTNARHYRALGEAESALNRALFGLQEGLPGDLLAEETKQVSFHLSEITGRTITSDAVLGEIFSKFCIGK